MMTAERKVDLLLEALIRGLQLAVTLLKKVKNGESI